MAKIYNLYRVEDRHSKRVELLYRAEDEPPRMGFFPVPFPDNLVQIPEDDPVAMQYVAWSCLKDYHQRLRSMN